MNARQRARANLPTNEEREWFDRLIAAFERWRLEEPTMPKDEILGHLLLESGIQDELGRYQLQRVVQAISRALGVEEPPT